MEHARYILAGCVGSGSECADRLPRQTETELGTVLGADTSSITQYGV